MTKVLEPGAPAWRVEPGAESGLLVDGRDYYVAFWDVARAARKWILISGWQFDSEVRLLRGEDQARAGGDDVRLVPFLNTLCERNPDLHIYLLAWDFNVVYAMEREYLQKMLFSWATHERVHFVFDGDHPVGASQHEKIVVVDGHVAFTGGIDLCENRWDDRDHEAHNEDRNTSLDHVYGPYHDVQAYLTGPAVSAMVEILRWRWSAVSDVPLLLPEVPDPPAYRFEGALPVPARRIGISRTISRKPGDAAPDVREIEQLYLRAIDAAEKLIYIETQYISSRSVREALVRRMRAADRSKLEIVILVPDRPEAVKEEVAIGVAQAKLLRRLIAVAEETGHALGVYDVIAAPERPVYMHSKLMIVDDVLLTVGSANVTNRSFGLDLEVNVVWEAEGDDATKAAIRRIRRSLLAEHCHGCASTDTKEFDRVEGLIAELDELAEAQRGRLHRHEVSTLFEDAEMPEVDLSAELDPDHPLEQDLFEMLSTDHRGVFARGISALGRWLMEKAGLVETSDVIKTPRDDGAPGPESDGDRDRGGVGGPRTSRPPGDPRDDRADHRRARSR